jgi:hypothetical protein
MSSFRHEWAKLELKPKDQTKVEIRLPLFQKNEDLLKQLHLEVSTPGSSKFRQYLSHEKIGDLLEEYPRRIFV